MRSSYDTDASVLLDSLRWDNLSLRRQKLKLGLMFKTLKSNAPSYLQEFFSIRGTGYNLRNSEMRLNLPKPRTNYLKRSFCYSGALLWNSLPRQEIRKHQTQAKFKKAVIIISISTNKRAPTRQSCKPVLVLVLVYCLSCNYCKFYRV